MHFFNHFGRVLPSKSVERAFRAQENGKVNLSDIEFADTSYGEEAWKALRVQLSKIPPNVSELFFIMDGCGITFDGFQYLSACLLRANISYNLDLSNNLIGENNTSNFEKENVFKILFENNKICSLSLSANQLHYFHFNVDKTSCLMFLRELNLSHNHLNDDTTKVLTDFFTSDECRLVYLYLHENQFGDEMAELVTTMLLRPSSMLQEINLALNKITNEGMCYIAKGIRFNGKLKMLNLRRKEETTIHQDVMKAFVDAIRENAQSNLSELILANNKSLLLHHVTELGMPYYCDPGEAVSNCDSDILSRLKKLRARPEKLRRVKIFLLGEASAGKTTLRKTMMEKCWTNYVDAQTIGVESKTFALNSIELCFLDFGAQSKYYPAYPMFFENDGIYIITFRPRLSSSDTLEKIQALIKRYRALIDSYAKHARIIVVGTCKDEKTLSDDTVERLSEFVRREKMDFVMVESRVNDSKEWNGKDSNYDQLQNLICCHADAIRNKLMNIPLPMNFASLLLYIHRCYVTEDAISADMRILMDMREFAKMVHQQFNMTAEEARQSAALLVAWGYIKVVDGHAGNQHIILRLDVLSLVVSIIMECCDGHLLGSFDLEPSKEQIIKEFAKKLFDLAKKAFDINLVGSIAQSLYPHAILLMENAGLLYCLYGYSGDPLLVDGARIYRLPSKLSSLEVDKRNTIETYMTNCWNKLSTDSISKEYTIVTVEVILKGIMPDLMSNLQVNLKGYIPHGLAWQDGFILRDAPTMTAAEVSYASVIIEASSNLKVIFLSGTTNFSARTRLINALVTLLRGRYKMQQGIEEVSVVIGANTVVSYKQSSKLFVLQRSHYALNDITTLLIPRGVFKPDDPPCCKPLEYPQDNLLKPTLTNLENLFASITTSQLLNESAVTRIIVGDYFRRCMKEIRNTCCQTISPGMESSINVDVVPIWLCFRNDFQTGVVAISFGHALGEPLHVIANSVISEDSIGSSDDNIDNKTIDPNAKNTILNVVKHLGVCVPADWRNYEFFGIPDLSPFDLQVRRIEEGLFVIVKRALVPTQFINRRKLPMSSIEYTPDVRSRQPIRDILQRDGEAHAKALREAKRNLQHQEQLTAVQHIREQVVVVGKVVSSVAKEVHLLHKVLDSFLVGRHSCPSLFLISPSETFFSQVIDGPNISFSKFWEIGKEVYENPMVIFSRKVKLYPIASDTMRPVEKEDGTLFYYSIEVPETSMRTFANALRYGLIGVTVALSIVKTAAGLPFPIPNIIPPSFDEYIQYLAVINKMLNYFDDGKILDISSIRLESFIQETKARPQDRDSQIEVYIKSCIKAIPESEFAALSAFLETIDPGLLSLKKYMKPISDETRGITWVTHSDPATEDASSSQNAASVGAETFSPNSVGNDPVSLQDRKKNALSRIKYHETFILDRLTEPKSKRYKQLSFMFSFPNDTADSIAAKYLAIMQVPEKVGTKPTNYMASLQNLFQSSITLHVICEYCCRSVQGRYWPCVSSRFDDGLVKHLLPHVRNIALLMQSNGTLDSFITSTHRQIGTCSVWNGLLDMKVPYGQEHYDTLQKNCERLFSSPPLNFKLLNKRGLCCESSRQIVNIMQGNICFDDCLAFCTIVDATSESQPTLASLWLCLDCQQHLSDLCFRCIKVTH